MRHRNFGRKFGRQPKHRVIMYQNLATALFEHERITTTLHKAKSMRPFIERLIHKAKKPDHPQTQIILNRDLKTKQARVNLLTKVAPRFTELPAGFTRIEKLGRRGIDKAQVATIELIGNAQSEFERNEEEVERESNGIKTFWEWEIGLLDQDEQYWENQLRQLKQTVDSEV